MNCNTSPIFMRSSLLLSIFLTGLLGIIASGGGGGGGGEPPAAGNNPSVAAKTSTIPPGDADCPNGGILVETGIDENANGVLDADEVDASEKVCNGANGSDGLSPLIDMSPEPVGANCPSGGLRIDTGIDVNGNGSLDPGEITQTGFVCNGTDGSLGWQVATLIELDNVGDALFPQVAVDASGNAMAVWYQSDGTRPNIWANRYVVGTGWGTAELIETDNTGGASNPQVAVDASGNAVAVWKQFNGMYWNIWANRYVAGTGWGTAELIETDDTGNAGRLQVAMDASGNAVTVWEQFDGTRYNIWANRYLPGFGWGTAELIETDNAESAYSPQVAMDSSGNAVAVWQQYDGTRYNIWANRYVAGTGWGTAELIETDNAGTAYFPQVAVDASGNAVAVWEQSDGTRTNIWANRYVAGTGWGTAELIETDNAGPASKPQVAVDASGNAVAVWRQSDGTRYNIWANRYVAGTGWGTPQLIETDNAGHAYSLQVAMDSSGNAMAVWYQSDGTRTNIWANRYVTGTGWGTAQLIETDNTWNASDPDVAMDSSGNAVAVWRQSDGTRYNIWANRWQAP